MPSPRAFLVFLDFSTIPGLLPRDGDADLRTHYISTGRVIHSLRMVYEHYLLRVRRATKGTKEFGHEVAPEPGALRFGDADRLLVRAGINLLRLASCIGCAVEQLRSLLFNSFSNPFDMERTATGARTCFLPTILPSVERRRWSWVPSSCSTRFAMVRALALRYKELTGKIGGSHGLSLCALERSVLDDFVSANVSAERLWLASESVRPKRFDELIDGEAVPSEGIRVSASSLPHA